MQQKNKEKLMDDKFAQKVAMLMEQNEQDDVDDELPRKKKIKN